MNELIQILAVFGLTLVIGNIVGFLPILTIEYITKWKEKYPKKEGK